MLKVSFEKTNNHFDILSDTTFMMEVMKDREHPYNLDKRKHIKIRFKCDFCEKATKIALKNGLNIDLGNILFVYLRDVKWNDLDKKSVKIDRNIMLFDYSS